jgi:site-specific DNA-cytosine methylase
MSELLCGSLFSGVGGMDIGFAWAGWRHAFFAEIEPFGRAVLAERFPDVPIYSDVRDVPECGSGIPWGEPRERVEPDGRLRRPDAEGNGSADGHGESDERPDSIRRTRLDVLTFGSPCQDLSVAGKRRGLDGDRSGLFWEAMRIAGDGPLRPRALLMENVEGLLSSNGGRDFALVLDAMAERGYRWSYRVLDSQHFGVPQRRRRVFVVGVADDDPRAERIGEVLALAEGGGGDSPTREPSWPDVAARIGAGAPSSSGRVVGTLTAQYGEQSGQDFGPGGAGLVTADDLRRTFTETGFSRYAETRTAETLCQRDYKDGRTLVAVPSMPADAHKAATDALAAAWERLHESGRDPYEHGGSDFCGCDDCEVRVVLRAAEPYMRERERERERSVVSAITQQTPARPDDKTAQAGHLIVEEKS